MQGCGQEARTANGVMPAARVVRIAPFRVMEILNAARELERRGRHVVHFEVGESDFHPAAPVVEAGVSALRSWRNGYTEPLGLSDLREAIARRYRHLGIDAQRIAVTSGVSAALNLLAQALVNPGDEVLVADPGYPCYGAFVETAGGRVRRLPVDANSGFQPTARQIDRAWSENTAGVILSSPSNPVGSLLGRDELAAICRQVAGKGFVIIDEIYQGLVYGDADPAFTALAVDDGCFVVNGFSKYYGMTGWRLGWIVAPAGLIDAIDRLAQNLYISPPAVSQHAALAALGDDALAIHEHRRDVFARRRDAMLLGLEALGLPAAQRPDGGFYVYANIASTGLGTEQFCRRLLHEYGVAATPGTDFGQHRAECHARFSFTVDETQIALGMERLEAALAAFRRRP